MKELLKPIRIGRMWVKNRLVMAPMNTNFSNENGAVAPQMEAYFTERAKNGVGLFVVEAASVAASTTNHAVQPLINDEKFVPGWFNMVDALHAYGAKVSIEIVHYGSEGNLGCRESASTISHFGGKVKKLSLAGIKRIQKEFVEAAVNVKTAGFDAVTLHAAHGYLLAEFLSPLYNKRNDRYGGSLKNRARFLLETVQKIREAVGPSFPIMVRYSVTEWVKGGRDIRESVELARMMEQAGVDGLDLSSCVPATYIFNIRPNNFGDVEGFLVPSARKIKEAVSIPVICSGGMRDPGKMEAIVKNGDADMIALGRALLADEEFCRKIIENRELEIRNCLSCQECLATLNSGKTVRCTVNCRTGREYRMPSLPKRRAAAGDGKKVLVIGGGPAGMAAALSAAKRGHRVTLCEAAAGLGGAMRPGSTPPGKMRMRELISWYERELAAAGVFVKVNSPCTPKLVKAVAPDIIVQATGAEYMRNIRGSDHASVMTASEALLQPEKVGRRVVIIGGGVSGSEAAEYFSGEPAEITFREAKDISGEDLVYSVEKRPVENQREISLVEMRSEICADMYEDNARVMRIKLKEFGIKIHCDTLVEGIEPGVIHLRTAAGKKFDVQADTIILSAGLAPKPLAVDLPDGVVVYQAGDAAMPGKIKDAIYMGDSIGRAI